MKLLFARCNMRVAFNPKGQSVKRARGGVSVVALPLKIKNGQNFNVVDVVFKHICHLYAAVLGGLHTFCIHSNIKWVELQDALKKRE